MEHSFLEESFRSLASVFALAVEAAVVLVVCIGAAQALWGIAVAATTGHVNKDLRRDVWLRFAVWILIALEFALAADIIRTAIAPTWDEIGKLGAIAAIRTGLNYFLAKDIENVGAESRSDHHEPSAR